MLVHRSNRLFSTPNKYHPISISYFNRVGIVDLREKNATNVFVLSIISRPSLLSACLNGALYLCSPTCYGASLHNLMSSSYLLSSTVSPSFSMNGWKFNGVNQFLKTGIIPNVFYSGIDNATFGVRSRTSGQTNTVEVGVSSSSTAQMQFQCRRTTDIVRISSYTNASLYDVSNADGSGNFFCGISSSTNRYMRRNKISLGTSSALHGNTLASHDFAIGARNNAGVLDSFSLREINGAWFFKNVLSESDCDYLSDMYDLFNANVILGGR